MKAVKKLLFGIALILFGVFTVLSGITNGTEIGWIISLTGLIVSVSGYFQKDE